jgi:putative aldouronate transport system substrate-binding protein
MNWLFSSRENHDLFQYGIKGKHWNEAKDDAQNVIANTVQTSDENPYGLPAYLLTWNPTYIRYPYASDPKVFEYSEYLYDVSSYTGRLYPSFQFDHESTEVLKTALANPAFGTYRGQEVDYKLGVVANPVSSWSGILNQRYTNVSLQNSVKVIKAELKKQLQDYLDNL